MRKLTDNQKNMLRRTADRVRREPNTYNQAWWGRESADSCGTQACIYGHAALEAGYVSANRGSDLSSVRRPRGSVAYDIVAVGNRLLGNSGNWGRDNHGYELWAGGWLPKGHNDGMGKRALANRVANALEGLADGKTLAEVSA